MHLLEWSLHALVSPSSCCVMPVFSGKDFTPLTFWILTSVWLVASILGGFHGSCQWTGAQVLPTLCSALPQAEVSKLTEEPNLVCHQSLYVKLYWDAATAMNSHITYDCFCATNAALSSTWERPYGPQYLEKVLSNLLILDLKIRCRERGSPPKATWGGRDHNCSTVGKFRTRKYKRRVRKLPVESRRWSRSWTVWIQAGSCPDHVFFSSQESHEILQWREVYWVCDTIPCLPAALLWWPVTVCKQNCPLRFDLTFLCWLRTG